MPLNAGLTHGAFSRPGPQEQHQGTSAPDLHPQKPRGRPDLQCLGTPPEPVLGRRVAPADQVDPKGIVHVGIGLGDLGGETRLLKEGAQPFEHSVQMGRNHRTLHQCVVGYDENAFVPLVPAQIEHRPDEKVQQQGAVLAAGECDDPGWNLGGKILGPDQGDDFVQHRGVSYREYT